MNTRATTPTPTLQRRLRGVALTYRRPAVWLLLTILLLVWGVTFLIGLSRPNLTRIAPDEHPQVRYTYIQSGSDRHKLPTSEGSDWRDLQSVALTSALPATLPSELRQSTRLEALRLMHGGWGGRWIPRDLRRQAESLDPWEQQVLAISANALQPEELDVLTAKFLSHLELEQSSLAPETLRTFGRRFPIQTLVIDEFTLQGQYDELRSFQSVELLIMRGSILSRKLIDVVLQLPRLQTLVLDTDEDREKSYSETMHPGVRQIPKFAAPTDLDLARLAAHPTLSWVFANWHDQGRTDAEARNLLRPLRAMPFMATRHLQGQVTAALVGSLVLVLLLIMQLGFHFIGPMPLVIPHAARDHLVWAALVLAVGVALGVAAGTQAELRPLPLTAVVLALPTLVSAIYVVSPRLTPRQQNLAGYVGFLFPLVMILPQWMWDQFGPACRWFLWGEQPGLALGLITAEVVVIGLGLHRLQSLYRRMSERGTTHALILEPREQQAWAQYPERWSPSHAAGVWAWHQGRSSRRAALWIRSLPFAVWKPSLQMSLSITLFFGVFQWLLWRRHLQTHSIIPWLPVMGLFIFAGFAVVFGPMTWITRQLLLGNELLRPARREEFVRDIFRACATSMWPVALGPLATGLFGVQSGWSAVEIVCGVAWVTGMLLFTGACGLWSFAVRMTMVNRILTSLPLFCSPVVIMLTLLSASHFGTGDMVMLLAALGLAGLFLTAAAALLTTTAYRRAVSREWGLD